jgi:hypothetical protein
MMNNKPCSAPVIERLNRCSENRNRLSDGASSTTFYFGRKIEAAVPLFFGYFTADDPEDQVVPSILSLWNPHLRICWSNG